MLRWAKTPSEVGRQDPRIICYEICSKPEIGLTDSNSGKPQNRSSGRPKAGRRADFKVFDFQEKGFEAVEVGFQVLEKGVFQAKGGFQDYVPGGKGGVQEKAPKGSKGDFQEKGMVAETGDFQEMCLEAE